MENTRMMLFFWGKMRWGKSVSWIEGGGGGGGGGGGEYSYGVVFRKEEEVRIMCSFFRRRGEGGFWNWRQWRRRVENTRIAPFFGDEGPYNPFRYRNVLFSSSFLFLIRKTLGPYRPLDKGDDMARIYSFPSSPSPPSFSSLVWSSANTFPPPNHQPIHSPHPIIS